MTNKADLSAFKQTLLTFALICAALAASAQSWTNRFHSVDGTSAQPSAMAVDGDGNVVVTGVAGLGGSGGESFYATIKYSNAGMPLWTKLYNGGVTGPVESWPNALASDSSGNVFVTGSSGVWTGGAGTDYAFATIKYASDGTPVWTNRFDEPGDAVAVGQHIKVDSQDNAIVSGSSRSILGSDDEVVTIKYSGAGVALWTNRYATDSSDGVSAMAVDTNGNVYLAGQSGPSFVLAYSATGLPLWTNFLDGSHLSSIAVNSNGTVFAGGYSFNNVNWWDFLTVAYSSAGVPLWTNLWNLPGSGPAEVSAMAVDRRGNVVVTGYYADLDYTIYHYATIMYSNAGLPLWTNLYQEAGGGFYLLDWGLGRYPPALAVDSSNNVVVSGPWQRVANPEDRDYVTIKYSGAGVPLWTNRYDGQPHLDDSATAVAVDESGNVFVSGSSKDNPLFYEFATIKYAAPPRLNVLRAAGSVVLSWPDPEFLLQSAVGVAGPFTNILGVVSPFTNAISGGRRFFQLKK